MKTLKTIINFFTEKSNLRKENKKLKSRILQLEEKNQFLESTVEDFAAEVLMRRAVKAPAVNKKERVVTEKKSTVPQEVIIKPNSFQDYHEVIPEDEVYKEVMKSMQYVGTSTGTQLSSGEPIVYQNKTDEDIQEILDYTKKTKKETKVNLGNNTSVIIAGHPDNSLSASFYDENGHLRSVSTAESEKSKQYTEDELKELLDLYGKRKDA